MCGFFGKMESVRTTVSPFLPKIACFLTDRHGNAATLSVNQTCLYSAARHHGRDGVPVDVELCLVLASGLTSFEFKNCQGAVRMFDHTVNAPAKNDGRRAWTIE